MSVPITKSFTKRPWFKTATAGHAPLAKSNTGPMVYNLPTFTNGRWEPGAWHPTVRNPSICNSGYHVTQRPVEWTGNNWEALQVFRVAIKGRADWKNEEQANKMAVSNMRFLRPVTPREYVKKFTKRDGSVTVSAAMMELWNQSPTMQADYMACVKEIEANIERIQKERQIRYQERVRKDREVSKRRHARWRAAAKRRRERERQTKINRELRTMERLAKKHGFIVRKRKGA
jgi:hypothetical protein